MSGDCPEPGVTSASARIEPIPFTVSAWWGDQLLAESSRALRLDVDGQEPSVWMPWNDIRADALTAAVAEAGSGGQVERHDATGPAPEPSGPISWSDDPHRVRDGVGVVRRLVTPPAGLETLAGYATVDHHQARVEVLDTVADEDPRDATVKRFPTWGDTADLVLALGGGVVAQDHRRPVVEGSQLLGQAVVAAMWRAPRRRVVSAHMVFLRPADPRRAVDLRLNALSEGRTFSTYGADLVQGERWCGHGTLMLAVPGPDVVRHVERADDVPGPYEAVPYDMGVTGRDLRVVDAAYTDDPDASVGPPSIDAWLRFRDLPDDPALHAGLLAQFTGHLSIAAALRPHAGVGQREAHRSISTAINAIALSFHAEPRLDRWVLYRHVATVVVDGMAHSECRVHAEDGELVASFSVDAMIRPLDRPGADARTTL
jgi:acyl-CoA thioesterase II